MITWNSQLLVLYHGTIHADAIFITTQGPKWFMGSHLKDFGRGFYTTTSLAQAQQWARIKAGFKGPKTKPAVVEFRLDRDKVSVLDILNFGLSSDEYWAFVHHCRTAPATDHRRGSQLGPIYDIVSGPVALVWRRREVKVTSDQFSFHTDAAIAVLGKGKVV